MNSGVTHGFPCALKMYESVIETILVNIYAVFVASWLSMGMGTLQME